jgi:hypothetical protein
LICRRKKKKLRKYRPVPSLHANPSTERMLDSKNFTDGGPSTLANNLVINQLKISINKFSYFPALFNKIETSLILTLSTSSEFFFLYGYIYEISSSFAFEGTVLSHQFWRRAESSLNKPSLVRYWSVATGGVQPFV